MHAAEERVVLLVDLERRGELGEDAVERAGLDASRRAACVAIDMLASEASHIEGRLTHA